jgi:tetrahydromethanopterin S-methyltransferase subunit H
VKKLFKFSAQQQVYDIKGVKIGGQPGQYPTVMIGSIFYHGDKIVEDQKEGVFNKSEAEKLLNAEAELSDRFGNPRIIDVVGSFPNALVKYIDFIVETVDSPFLIDGTTEAVRIAGLKHAAEIGVIDRAIYNSITPEIKREEIEAIKESGIKTAILLTLNSKNPTLQGRMEALESLLKIAKEAGVQQFLIDTTIIDIPDPGVCAKAIYLEKEKYGYPAGCGAHNAVDRWRQIKKLEPNVKLIATTVANIFPIALGANFALYGPIKNASEAYEMMAIADAYVSYAMSQEFKIKPESKVHPISRVFRK